MKIPFTPAVYENAARFTGRSPWEVSRDPELLHAGHRAAYLEYRHQPIAVGIDIYTLEAEAYGAVVEKPVGNGSAQSVIPSPGATPAHRSTQWDLGWATVPPWTQQSNWLLLFS